MDGWMDPSDGMDGWMFAVEWFFGIGGWMIVMEWSNALTPMTEWMGRTCVME